MIDRFNLVKWKRLDNVYKMSQHTYYFEHEITMYVRRFSQTVMQRLA